MPTQMSAYVYGYECMSMPMHMSAHVYGYERMSMHMCAYVYGYECVCLYICAHMYMVMSVHYIQRRIRICTAYNHDLPNIHTVYL